MVLHLTTCPMMLLWSSTSMVTTQGVLKIWIYTYQDVQNNFVNAVSYIQAVCCGMTCPMSWKNPVHLMYLKATIVSSLVDNLWVYMGKFICQCTLFIRPSLDGTYYGMALSVRPSVRPSVRSSVRPTVSTKKHRCKWRIFFKFCTLVCLGVPSINLLFVLSYLIKYAHNSIISDFSIFGFHRVIF